MKKQGIILFITILPLFFVSCVSTPVQAEVQAIGILLDESIPVENTAIIEIFPAWTIKTFNGIPVQLPKSTWSPTYYRIQEGNTKLTMDLKAAMGNITYVAYDIPLDYYYEGGKHYVISFQRSSVMIQMRGDRTPIHTVPLEF